MTVEVPKHIDTVLWDLDGTLIDSYGIFCEVLTEILPRHGRVVPAGETMAQNFHGTLAESIASSIGGAEGDEVESIVRSFLEVQDQHYEIIDHHLFPDALKLAMQLHSRGLRQIIVTNREHAGRQLASPRSIVERSQLKQCIDEIVCGDDGVHRKPFTAVLDPLKQPVEPETTLVIGDQHVDAALARNLGASAIVVNRNGPDKRLDEFADEVKTGKLSIVPTLAGVSIQE